MDAIAAYRSHDPVVREILRMQVPEGMGPSLLRQYNVATACVQQGSQLARMIARSLAAAAHAARRKQTALKAR